MKSNAINPENARIPAAAGGIDEEAWAASAVAARMVVTMSPYLLTCLEYFTRTP